jgi:16S rRNA processing protein RimM
LDFIKTGKLVATHGFNGEIVMVHELGKKTTLKGLRSVFLPEKNGSLLPWFVQSVKAKSEKEVLIRLEGIDSKEAAVPALQKEVWLTKEDFDRYAAKTATAGLLGYMILDAGKELGPVLELIEQPHQLLCRIEVEGKEVLIPLHEDSLGKIDHRKKTIQVNLPEGLLDIYL